jgi:hypothetical protein
MKHYGKKVDVASSEIINSATARPHRTNERGNNTEDFVALVTQHKEKEEEKEAYLVSPLWKIGVWGLMRESTGCSENIGRQTLEGARPRNKRTF